MDLLFLSKNTISSTTRTPTTTTTTTTTSSDQCITESPLLWIHGKGPGSRGSVLVILAQNGYTKEAHTIIGLSRTASLIGRDSNGGLPELWDVMGKVRNKRGITRLMAICITRGPDSPQRALSLIRDHKVDVRATDKKGRTALYHALGVNNNNCDDDDEEEENNNDDDDDDDDLTRRSVSSHHDSLLLQALTRLSISSFSSSSSSSSSGLIGFNGGSRKKRGLLKHRIAQGIRKSLAPIRSQQIQVSNTPIVDITCSTLSRRIDNKSSSSTSSSTSLSSSSSSSLSSSLYPKKEEVKVLDKKTLTKIDIEEDDDVLSHISLPSTITDSRKARLKGRAVGFADIVSMNDDSDDDNDDIGSCRSSEYRKGSIRNSGASYTSSSSFESNKGYPQTSKKKRGC